MPGYVSPTGSLNKTNFSSGIPFADAPRLYALSQKPTGPRWTIAGRYPSHEEPKKGQIPGPGAYSPSFVATSPPQWSMLARRDSRASTSGAPGPGAYSPDGKLRKQIPITLQGRHFPKDGNKDAPGPGAYTPVNPNYVSPRFSLKARHDIKTGDNTPGPLDYRPEKPFTKRATSLHPRIKAFSDSSAYNPGPGAYTIGHERISSKITPPAYSLGGRIDYNPASGVLPGPGAYNGEKPHRKIAFSMTPRRQDITGSGMTPGPGAYSPQRPVSGGAGFGIGDRFDHRDRAGVPGPGAYTPKVNFYSVKAASPQFSMTSRGKTLDFNKNAPGPGHYNPSVSFVKASSPKHTLHARLSMGGKGNDTPGPAAYNADRPSTAPAFTLKGRVPQYQSFITPSPLAYNVGDSISKVKTKAPSYTLGGRVDYAPKNGVTPGPGAYETAFTFFEKVHRYY